MFSSTYSTLTACPGIWPGVAPPSPCLVFFAISFLFCFRRGKAVWHVAKFYCVSCNHGDIVGRNFVSVEYHKTFWALLDSYYILIGIQTFIGLTMPYPRRRGQIWEVLYSSVLVTMMLLEDALALSNIRFARCNSIADCAPLIVGVEIPSRPKQITVCRFRAAAWYHAQHHINSSVNMRLYRSTRIPGETFDAALGI